MPWHKIPPSGRNDNALCHFERSEESGEQRNRIASFTRTESQGRKLAAL